MAPPTRSGSLRLVDDGPFRPEETESITVNVPNNEIAPGVTLDGGVMHVEHDDGSVEIDFAPKEEITSDPDDNDFYANLCGKLDEGTLAGIAADLLDGIQRDVDSRKEWLETRARGIQLLGLKLEEPRGDTGTSSSPVEGMSTVRHPLLLDATVNFQATARGELLPASGPVKVRNDSPAKSPSQSQAPPPPPLPGPGAAGGPEPQVPAPPSFPQPFADGGVVPPTPMAGVAAPQPPAPPPGTGINKGPDTEEKAAPGGEAQAESPFATELAVPPTEELDSLAAALEIDFNHYLTITAREYYPDTDRMLFYVGFGGDGFKKVYNCPLRRRPVSESVDAEDFIVSNSATDLSNCGRVTHRIKMRKSILKRMQILGVYADVDLIDPTPEETSPVDEEKQDIEGYNPLAQKPEDQDYTIYECYCEWDLDEFAPADLKGKGLPLPYRVTIEKTSRKILSIIRNWHEEDAQALPKQFFVQFPFIRGLGFYGLGFVHLLGNSTSTLTAMQRIMCDAGMFANFPGFLFTKGAGRQLTNQFRIPPGGGMGLEVPMGGRIQDSVMPVPYHEPGPGFTAFAQWMEAAGQRLGQTGQIAVGEGKQDVPVGTTLALIEQATKIINSAHKRLHAAQSEEFTLLKERFKEDPEAFWRQNKKPAMPWEKEQFRKALDNYNIVPVADPNNPTSLHRAAKAQIIEGTASKYPQIINLQAALKRIYRVAGIDPEGLFHDKPLPPPPDPRMVAISEKAKSTEKTVKAQTDSTMAKTIAQVILGMKQVEQKTQDAQQRQNMEQMRLMLEATKGHSEMQQEQASRAQELQHEQAKTQQQLAAEQSWTQQELEADRQRQKHELGSELVTKATEGQTELMARRHELQIARQEQADKLRMEREQHRWEMHRKQQEKALELRCKQEDHAHEMRCKQEMHEAELAQAKALAKTQKKSDSSKKTTTKTTRANPTGTRKTETTETKED